MRELQDRIPAHKRQQPTGLTGIIISIEIPAADARRQRKVVERTPIEEVPETVVLREAKTGTEEIPVLREAVEVGTVEVALPAHRVAVTAAVEAIALPGAEAPALLREVRVQEEETNRHLRIT